MSEDSLTLLTKANDELITLISDEVANTEKIVSILNSICNIPLSGKIVKESKINIIAVKLRKSAIPAHVTAANAFITACSKQIPASSSSTPQQTEKRPAPSLAIPDTPKQAKTESLPTPQPRTGSPQFVLGRTNDPSRDKLQALLHRELAGSIDEEFRVELAIMIEQCCWKHFPSRTEYIAHIRLVIQNLRDESNPDFREALYDGLIVPQDIPTMESHAMASKKSQQERQEMIKYELEASKTDLTGGQKGVDMFPCPACKGKETTFYQRQTRSSDEPMTIFCRCTLCNKRWRIY